MDEDIVYSDSLRVLKYCESNGAKGHPDLFLDLITPETGGIRLDLDQRVFIRTLVRFVSVYAVFPRG